VSVRLTAHLGVPNPDLLDGYHLAALIIMRIKRRVIASELSSRGHASDAAHLFIGRLEDLCKCT